MMFPRCRTSNGESGIQTWARTGSVKHGIITNRILTYAPKMHVFGCVIESWMSFHLICKRSAI